MRNFFSRFGNLSFYKSARNLSMTRIALPPYLNGFMSKAFVSLDTAYRAKRLIKDQFRINLV